MTRTEMKLEALRGAAGSAPEYAEILPFFIAIQEYIKGREGLTGISATPTAALDERNREGFPLLSPTDLVVEREAALGFLSGLSDVVKANGKAADEQLDKLLAALQGGELDPARLFSAILERRREPLEQTAEQIGVQAPLVEFLLEIPLRVWLESFAAGYQMTDVAGWQEGFCPICGSRPVMSEISGDDGRRLLACSSCSFKWPFKRIRCLRCGNEETEQQSYFTVDEGPVRVDICKACHCYIKTRDARKGGADIPLDVVDALTIHLDLMAAREGYERER